MDICPCKVFYTYCVVTSGRSSFLNPQDFIIVCAARVVLLLILMAGFVASCPKTSSNFEPSPGGGLIKENGKVGAVKQICLVNGKNIDIPVTTQFTMPMTKPILQSHLLFHLCNFIQANKDWVSWKLLRQGFYSLMLLKRIQT